MARVAWIGLGVMGFPMAGHLSKKGGHDVTVYNRNPAKAEAWVAKHGGGARSPRRRPRRSRADFVFCCVGNDDDLRAVTTGPDGAFRGMRAGAVFIDHTTASAEVARELHAAGAARGIAFLDAPVSGGQAGAENGTLTVMVGGDEEPFARAKPLIETYARAVNRIGPSGAGQLTKMVNQIAIAGLLQGLSEAIAFAEAAGLDLDLVMRDDLQGRRAVLADGQPLAHHARGQVRLRLCRRLDAQGSRHLPRRGAAQRRAAARDGAGRRILRQGAGDGRRPLGYLEPHRAAEAREAKT